MAISYCSLKEFYDTKDVGKEILQGLQAVKEGKIDHVIGKKSWMKFDIVFSDPFKRKLKKLKHQRGRFGHIEG